ncbi:thioesterase-like superfamily-domain-containing protein [Hyaloraphidium curvatum]|nr:thioesterase-like superfamily-domain-containing protein [Hyaloraphidium curvatum]
MSPQSHAFDASIALRSPRPDLYTLRLDPSWSGGGGVPFGGYSAALAAKAMQLSLESYPHAVSVTVELFGAPKADAEVEIEVRAHRRGKSFGTASCVLREAGGDEFGACLGTFGTLAAAGEAETLPHYARGAARPPEPGDAVDAWALSGAAGWFVPPPPFINQMKLRTSRADFEATKSKISEARASPVGSRERLLLGEDADTWISMADDRPLDVPSVVCFADLIGALNYGIRFMPGGSVPRPPKTFSPHSSLSLAVRFFAPPTGTALRARPMLVLRRGELVEYEVALWDADGKLVATGRQSALVRAIPEEVLERTRRMYGRPKV